MNPIAIELQPAYGVLKHHCGASHLEEVLNGILSTIADNPAVITLRAVAKAASQAQQEQLEHTETAELPVILSDATVLRLVALAQFTAILVGLVV